MPHVVHVKSRPLGHQSTNESLYIGRGPNGRHLLNTAIGQPGWLGNPFPIPKFRRKECIRLFREVFEARLRDEPEFRAAVLALRGLEEVRCYCAPLACHGDVICEFLEKQNENIQNDSC